MPSSLTGAADLHMHTTASDGVADVQTLLAFVADERPDLDVIAITDHDTLDASLWAYQRRDRYPFDVVPGVEVSSQAGHVLALWVTQPIPAQMSLSATVEAIHEAGGVAVLAHPFNPYMANELFPHAWRYGTDPTVLVNVGVDAIEGHNAAIAGVGCNWLASTLAHKLALPVVGGSDAHTLGAIGRGITRFAGCTAADLRQALRQSSTKAEGTAWSIQDYFAYMRHERQRRVTTSSGTINSSPLTNR